MSNQYNNYDPNHWSSSNPPRQRDSSQSHSYQQPIQYSPNTYPPQGTYPMSLPPVQGNSQPVSDYQMPPPHGYQRTPGNYTSMPPSNMSRGAGSPPGQPHAVHGGHQPVYGGEYPYTQSPTLPPLRPNRTGGSPPYMPASSSHARHPSSSSHHQPQTPPSPELERYPCTKCDKTFSRAHDRKRHYETQHSVNPPVHKCQYCGKEFSRNDSLKRHLDNGCEKDPSYVAAQT